MSYKQIFTIHSPITFLMAVSIIRHKKIKEQDAIIISSGYKSPLNNIDVKLSYSESHNTKWRKLRHLNIAKHFDKYINEITDNKPFIAYIDIMHNYQKFLVTNEMCKEFHFFEEGTASYMTPKPLIDFAHTAFIQKFRNFSLVELFKEFKMLLRGFSSSIHSLPYHPQSYQYKKDRKYYTISNFCYPGVSNNNKVLIKPEFTTKELSILSSDIQLKNAVIIIEETYPKDFNIKDKIYKRALEQSIKRITKDEQKRIFIKLRPNKSKKKSRLVALLDQLNINYKILPNTTLAEGIFLNSENLIVLGFVSSLLMYAKIFGHTSYSMIDLLPNRPKTRFDSINGFESLVEKLINN